MKRHKGRWAIVLFFALAITVASVPVLMKRDSDFDFLTHTRQLSEIESVSAPSWGGSERYSSLATYSSKQPLDRLSQLADEELLAKGWKKGDPELHRMDHVYTKGSKIIQLTSFVDEVKVFVWDDRPPTSFDRATIWMKGLWKKSK